MTQHAGHEPLPPRTAKNSPEQTAGVYPDPHLIEMVKYLARRAAERDHAASRKSGSETGSSSAAETDSK